MRNYIAFILGLILLLALIFWPLALCHGSTTSAQKTNSLGADISQVNPNINYVAMIIEGSIVGDRKNVGTNLRLHPKYMYALFDEAVLFCGDVSPFLTDENSKIIQGYLVFTYRRAASRLINEVPCHELVAVDRLEK